MGDRRLAALSQAGLVEKFVDALVWIVLPVWLFARGLSLTQIGWVTGTYGMVWGVAQLWTGRLSDRVGRYWPNVGGMWVCGAGVAMYPLGEGMVWWMAASGVTGMGWRCCIRTCRRRWRILRRPRGGVGHRDLPVLAGYWLRGGRAGAGPRAGAAEAAAFWLVAGAMALSGALLALWGEETRPGKGA